MNFFGMDASCFRTFSRQNIHFFFIIIFIFLSANSYASKDDFRYANCSLPLACGPTHVEYPFWGSGRPIYCGLPGFELGCQDDEYAFLDFKGQRFRVLEINQSGLVMTVARNDLWGTLCLQDRIVNTTMDNSTVFGYTPGVKNLTIFYCPNPEANQLSPLVQMPCPTASIPNRTAVFVDDQVMALVLAQHPELNGCNTRIKVPVLQTALGELEQGLSKDWTTVLNRGFELAYLVDRGCSRCKSSGGVCGSDLSPPHGFVCYCPDQPHPYRCPDNGRSDDYPKIVVGAVGGGLVLSMLIALYVCKRLRSAPFNGRKSDRDIENFIKQHGSLAPERFSYSQVKRMTNSFKNKLGEGGFGAVYSGRLSDGTVVAVKLLNASKGNGEEFINEVTSISRTSHINIVTLLGFCYEGHNRALVYEFMSNGSLDKFIADENGSRTGPGLGWEKLYQIAIGIARGLEYLHRGCNTRILHFDIKPQNILLDEELCPKISDFGLAKLCLKKESIVSMLAARGTLGYIAPELFSRNFGEVSHKSDVYSYGMVLLEMVGGRKNLNDEADRGSEVYFHDQVYEFIEEGCDEGVYGPLTEEEKQAARKMATVGIWCIQAFPGQRPSMKTVIEMLEGAIDATPIPPKPCFSSSPRTPRDSFSLLESP